MPFLALNKSTISVNQMNNYTSFISINMNFYAKINQFYHFGMEKFQHRMKKFCIQTYQAKVMFIENIKRKTSKGKIPLQKNYTTLNVNTYISDLIQVPHQGKLLDKYITIENII